MIDPNALQVTSVSPSAGPIGTSVTLTGHGFSQVQKVSWGGGASSGFTLVSDTQITTAVPAGQPDGQQAILLQTASGATAIALFFVGSAPAVTGFSPASAFIGQPVTISGSSLTGATAVKFNGTAASFSVVSDAQVSATVPFGASSGAISVTTPLGTASSASSFTVLVPAPTVASVVPSSGPTAGGGPITITGNFFQNGATVTLGGTAASSLSVVNPQTITAVAPAHAAGAVAVVVTNPDTQSGTLAAGYTYVPPPQPSAIAPQAGTANGGTSVTVSGSGFVAGATLSIGGSAAQVASVTATSITATTGPHAAGVVDVVVKNPDGQTGTLPSAFSYNAAPKPILSMAQPSTGSSNGGTSVTLSGASFAPGATVAFGGTPAANVTFGDPTSLVAVTPPHAVGAVDVTLVNPDGQMAVLKGGFTFVPGAAPLLSSVAPAMGPSNGGTTLTLGGMNFAGGATVTVGGVAAQIGSVTATSIIAKTGAHAAGTADVVVTNPDGQSSTKTAAFTYVADPAPAVTSIAPAFGPGTGGTSITVGGTNFVAGATITIGASAASSVAFVDAMTLTGVTGASTPGQADVIVTNPDGQTGTLKAGWIYTQAPPPTLTSVTPAAGLSTGGTNVTLAGKHLVSGATVSFGGAAASNVVVAADGLSLTATTAAHASGVVDVTLVNPDGQMVTLTGGFTYTPAPAPTVSAIAPANGPAAGGTMVSITGDHFVAGAAVAIGGAAATSVNVVSPTSIVAVTAANSPGAVDVVVTNPDGQKGTLAGGFTYDAPPDMAQPLDMTQTPPDLSGGDMADGGVTPPPDLATPLDFSTPSPSPDLSTPSPSPDLAMPPNAPAPDMAMAPSSGGGCDAAGGSPGFGLLAAALVAALLLRKRKILPPSRR